MAHNLQGSKETVVSGSFFIRGKEEREDILFAGPRRSPKSDTMAEMKKRRFVRLFLVAAGSVVGAVVGIPAGVVALHPSRRRHDRAEVWQEVGPLRDFPVGRMTRAVVPVPRADWSQSLREKGIFVLRKETGDIVVFSRNCTDLGCPITWDPGSEWFFCPCHGGIFSKEGEAKAGPPKEPLYRYATRVRGEVLEINLNSIPPMA